MSELESKSPDELAAKIPADLKVATVGLGYVGLPLAVEFGKRYETVGFDIDPRRIQALVEGHDATREVSRDELESATRLSFTTRAEDMAQCTIFVVTVPTPIDAHRRPDLSPMRSASELVGSVLKAGDIVIYESTVYPGATEDFCVPILEQVSGLRYNQDFHVGYSPERINPGDRTHRLPNICKVTSGSDAATAATVDALYRSIIPAGTHRASSIKVAEAAKVIENTQRDVNIALVNELALIFERLDIDTIEVLEAAGTKWNFLPFRPGLVGGHCISVDPYYLTHKAQEIGYEPEVILAGRKINDGMGVHIAERVIKMMLRKKLHIVDARVLLLGFAFKENCPDLRNTRVVDIYKELTSYHALVDVYDPWVDPEQAEREYGIKPIEAPSNGVYDAIILAVAHDQFRAMGATAIRKLGRPECVVFDVKNVLPRADVDGRL